ncbi:MAG: DUF3048 domain-containing protein [Candidatus Saccharibacteria bacterium]
MKLLKHRQLSWSHFRQWLSKHRKIAWAIGGVVIICVGGLTAFLILSHKPNTATKKVANKTIVKTTPKPEPVKYYSPLTGSLVASEAATQQTVTGVMIENSPDARPQSGLKDSGVVFEAIAEGGITRFLVLYQSEKPQMIGPVRSLRLYDVDWLAAFGAGIAHVGGSAAALSEVRNGNYHDLDQFFNPGSFWRSTDRWAPHNVYTSFEKLDALNAAKGYTTANFTGFSRVDGKPSATPNATNINIVISSYLYNSTYAYDKATNTYARSQAGEAHLDRESGQITPSVVIAMRVDETTVLEDGYRETINTIGSGNATIFQNGIATSAVWHKSSKTSQITFTDANGQNIPLVRGQTWIAAVPNDGGDVTWQ